MKCFQQRLLGSAALIAASVVALVRYLDPPPSAALARFYTQRDAAEDMLMDPLILAGEDVVPLVLEAMDTPSMPRRRYAIGFLGNGRFPNALQPLHRLLQDSDEEVLFRGDALQAICSIDWREGKRLAATFASRTGHLGYVAQGILQRGCSVEPRTYADALFGHRD